MELIPAQKQKVWKWPAATNFSLGGMGTGFYLVGLLLVHMTVAGSWFPALLQTAPFKLLGPALVGLGFLALTTEAGRPQRGLNLFRHLRRSWMSRETLAAALFIPLAGLDWLFPNPALSLLAAAAGLALMVCQGFILYRARGVTAWNSRWMPLFFITSGLATGSGLMLVVLTLFNLLFGARVYAVVPLPLVALGAGVLNLGIWWVYTWKSDRAFQKATSALRHPNALAFIVGVGHLLPIVLLLLTLTLIPSGAPQSATLVVAGLALMFGGVRQKFGIILEAGYLRPIVLPIPRAQTIVEARPS
jgi:phenylacetyl-CoA:acceptor oxidoreductase 26-kDa subunit